MGMEVNGKEAIVGMWKGAMGGLEAVSFHCVHCMSPGATDTGVFTKMDAIDPQLRHLVAKTSPLGRLADPAEIAAAIAFLVSDGCGFMTGSELLVDGGALAVHPGF